MTTRAQFLEEIEKFIADKGLSAAAFGFKAVGDNAFVARLRKGDRGADPRLSTVERCQAFMRTYRKPRKRKCDHCNCAAHNS